MLILGSYCHFKLLLEYVEDFDVKKTFLLVYRPWLQPSVPPSMSRALFWCLSFQGPHSEKLSLFLLAKSQNPN